MGPIGQQFQPLNLNLGQGQGAAKSGQSGASGASNPFASAGIGVSTAVKGGDDLDNFKAQFSGDVNKPAAPTSLGIGQRLDLSA